MLTTAEGSTSTKRLRSIIGGSAGNFVEWYDWFAYASLAIYFAPSFFPEGDRTAQLLNAAAIFGVGFVMRPIGAWAMGVYGDRHGRKAGLALSVGLMCAGSLLIAIAPTYAEVGWVAPAVLVLARLLQGLSVGGEFGASSTYLSEMAARGQRGFWSSFHYVTLIGGQLAALGVLLLLQAVMTEAALESWGWRIPFALGAVLALAVFVFRRGLAETDAFHAIDRSGTPASSVGELWRNHKRASLMIIMMTAGSTLAFYTYTTYLQKFLVGTSGFTRPTATAITAAVLALGVFVFRRGLAETDAFHAIDRSGTPASSVGELWRNHKRASLMIVMMTAGSTLAFYTYTTYLQKFLVGTSGFTRPTATAITAAALAVFALQQPLWGALSDRFGRKPQMIFFGVAGILVTVPVFTALAGVRDPLTAFLLAVVPLTIMSAYTSVGPITKAELFPAHIRTLGVAFPYAIANTMFGAPSEYVALWLKKNSMEPLYFWGVTGGIGIALIAFLMLPDTKKTSLIAGD